MVLDAFMRNLESTVRTGKLHFQKQQSAILEILETILHNQQQAPSTSTEIISQLEDVSGAASLIGETHNENLFELEVNEVYAVEMFAKFPHNNVADQVVFDAYGDDSDSGVDEVLGQLSKRVGDDCPAVDQVIYDNYDDDQQIVDNDAINFGSHFVELEEKQFLAPEESSKSTFIITDGGVIWTDDVAISSSGESNTSISMIAPLIPNYHSTDMSSIDFKEWDKYKNSMDMLSNELKQVKQKIASEKPTEISHTFDSLGGPVMCQSPLIIQHSMIKGGLEEFCLSEQIIQGSVYNKLSSRIGWTKMLRSNETEGGNCDDLTRFESLIGNNTSHAQQRLFINIVPAQEENVIVYMNLTTEGVNEFVMHHFCVESRLGLQTHFYLLKQSPLSLYHSSKKPNNTKFYTPHLCIMENLEKCHVCLGFINGILNSLNPLCISSEKLQ
ncbi:hypothetical protein LIER_24261 [Lithospermum erythrorhizon]|uniref:Uncharacterized protein n=1 Tax=Lithospermum erythrorhizon TaxID=34254 RepID=A0AAV3R4P9_LITER